jgi:Insertion element 4 transposase N-terminal/Transposase DDE domain
MGFDRAFQLASMYATPKHVDDFRRQVSPEWIDEALAATGTATVRKRRLPSEQVVWIVLGMGLFRDRPVEDIVSKLELALPGQSSTVARSSVSQARERVGSEPMRWLFERCAAAWAGPSADNHRWRGLSLYGIDGSTVRVPDTPENREAFGGQKGRDGTVSGYPMVRITVLMVLRSHLLAGANFGRYEGTYELEYAKPLCERLPGGSLTLVDKGYFGAPLLLGIERGQDRHWLTRARSNLSARVVERFGAGDELVEMQVSKEARARDATLPRTWLARRVRYQRPGFREQWLLTSLRDPKRFPAAEIATLYHERWEIELGYDEIKTELLEREEAIRSRKPDGVRQELWGLLLVYNLVRQQMQSIAREAKIEPTRISFVEALRLMRDEWAWLSVTSPGAIPKRLEAMRRAIKRYVLPPRRPRRFPRVVKLKMSNYDRKRPLAERAK